MPSEADRTIALYQRYADDWDRERSRWLLEKSRLDRFLAVLPSGATVLDIGCGSGEPISRYLAENGCALTGVDSSPRMIDKCRERFPAHSWVVGDMRKLDLHRRFNGILAWDSFFHLCPEDQYQMFPIFSKHAASRAALLFTSGPSHGESIGTYKGEPLYHGSLSSDEYRLLLHQHGFDVLAHIVDDPACGNHTVWLAQLGIN
jgi:SAM-dependent methyltransferase